jgi:hypothetical protein
MKVKLSGRQRMILAMVVCILASPLTLRGVEKPFLELSPEDRALLEKGKLVFKIEEFQDGQGDVNHRLKTFRLINAPPEEVWKVLTNPEKDFEWIPGVNLSEVLKKEKNYSDIRYEVDVLFMTFQFHIHRVFNKDVLFIKNDLINDMENDLKVADSYYALYPCDDGNKTIMNYSLLLVVSQNIPKAVEDWFTKQSCKGWMENLKKRAESKGTWRK